MSRKSNDKLPTITKLEQMTAEHKETEAAEIERLTLQREAASDALQIAEGEMNRALVAADADAYHQAKQARDKAADTIEMIDLHIKTRNTQMTREEFESYVNDAAAEIYNALILPNVEEIAAAKATCLSVGEETSGAIFRAARVLYAAQKELCTSAADMTRPGGKLTYIEGAGNAVSGYAKGEAGRKFGTEIPHIFGLPEGGGNE